MMLKAMLSKGFLILFLLITPCHIQAIIDVQGSILNDTTWTNKDTIKVINTVTVPDSVQLTIEAGTFIYVEQFKSIEVNGLLNAQGEENSKIVFTSSADTLGGTPSSKLWISLYFKSNSTGILKNCHVKYAIYPIQAAIATLEAQQCIVENFSLKGFYIDGVKSNPPVSVVLDRCIAQQTEPFFAGKGTGIHVYQSADVAISRCRVYNCAHGIELYSHQLDEPHFQITSCDIRDNDTCGIYIHVCG